MTQKPAAPIGMTTLKDIALILSFVLMFVALGAAWWFMQIIVGG